MDFEDTWLSLNSSFSETASKDADPGLLTWGQPHPIQDLPRSMSAKYKCVHVEGNLSGEASWPLEGKSPPDLSVAGTLRLHLGHKGKLCDKKMPENLRIAS